MRGVARPVLRLVGVVVLVGWFLVLRPTGLGGPAGYVVVSGKSMLPTLETGDLVLTERHATYGAGDLVAYRVNGKLVIHRVVGGNGVDGYEMRGDNNAAVDPWRPTDADIIGASRLVVPNGGIPIRTLRNDPLLLACFAGGLALFVCLVRGSKNPDTPSPDSSVSPEVSAS